MGDEVNQSGPQQKPYRETAKPEPQTDRQASQERIDTDGDGRTRDRNDNSPNADVLRESGKPAGSLQP